jgi:anhydro-N-acetylmuramic acid kinase
MLRTIGLMSGTSLDGVDAAAIETDGVTIGRLGPTLTLPYSPALRADLRDLLDRAPTLDPADRFLSDVTIRLTAVHAQAVAELGEPADLIGFHGQTILHQPHHRRTWQIGDAAALAAATQTRIAYDFRSADVAAGGQGAPLVPLFHAALATHLPRPLAILNLGGVANITYITEHGVTAADIGPGNGPLDDWIARHTPHAFDPDGRISAAGTPDPAVLARLMADPFFAKPWPKSLDRLDFTARLAESGLDTLTPEHGAATLVAFIAAAAAVAPIAPQRWLVCGGGRHNPSIMRALRQALPVPVDPVEAVGWNGDAIEAQCFGYLAARVVAGLPLTLPGTTGAPAPMRGGRLTKGSTPAA